MSKPIIEVKNVSKTFKLPTERINNLRDSIFNLFSGKHYREFKALDNVSFEVKQGEFVGIIGKNGSGKSTLLKILAGVYEPDKGKVIINGKISPFLELGVGFNGELSARDNIYLNATILGLSEKQINEKFDKIIEFAELQEFVETKVKNFSSGMYARIAFSVAIEAEADIYIMDEVLAVGDADFQRKCFKKFTELREKQKTVILVSHDLTSILNYCTHVKWIDAGKIQFQGKTEEGVNKYLTSHQKQTDTFEEVDMSTSPAIKKVTILDEKNNTALILDATKEYRIEVRLSNFEKEKFKTINIGIGLYSSDGKYLFSYNTSADEFKIQTDKKVSLKIPELNLLQGTYHMNVVCFGNNEQTYYDLKNRAIEFKVTAKEPLSLYRGHIFLKHTWQND